LLPPDTFQHLESKWPCTQNDFVLKETELGLLTDEDSNNLLCANFPLLQVRQFLGQHLCYFYSYSLNYFKIFIQSVVMVNSQHFKATPLWNLLKRSFTVNPNEPEKDSLQVLNRILKDLSLNQRAENQNCGITYNQV